MPYIEGGGVYNIQGKSVFGRKLIVDVKDAESIRKRFKNKDVYTTIMTYDIQDQANANLYGPLYIDLDLDIQTEMDYSKIKTDVMTVLSTLNVVFKVPYEMIEIYFSGNKGFHIIVQPEIFGIKKCKDLNEQYKKIATEIKTHTKFKTVDTKIYDRVRLFRMVNSINGKSGLYKVPITVDFLKASDYNAIVEYASQPRQFDYLKPKFNHASAEAFKKATAEKKEPAKARSFNQTGFKKLSVCIEMALQQPAAVGARNNTAVVLASSLSQTGMDKETVLEKINCWNETYNTPALSQSEIRKTVESAHSGTSTGRAYGCTAIKNLGLCIPSLCHIKK